MAPKRNRTKDNESPSAAAAAAATGRVTRSAARRVTRSTTSSNNAPLQSVSAHPEPRKRKKAKTTPSTSAAAGAEPEANQPTPADQEPGSEPEVLDGSKTIIIEHCKQCNSFKTRAIQVKNGLEKSVVGVNVVVNPEKPRRGCFEIREEGGEVFISLLDMKRPFTSMKELDMEEVISDIVDKIK